MSVLWFSPERSCSVKGPGPEKATCRVEAWGSAKNAGTITGAAKGPEIETLPVTVVLIRPPHSFGFDSRSSYASLVPTKNASKVPYISGASTSAKIDAALKDLDGFLADVQADTTKGPMTDAQHRANCDAADYQFGFGPTRKA